MKIIPVLVLSLFLSGCWHLPKRDEAPVTPKVVHIDAAALVKCQKLDDTTNLGSFEQFLVAYGDLATKYASCANKHSDNIELLKAFGNIK